MDHIDESRWSRDQVQYGSFIQSYLAQCAVSTHRIFSSGAEDICGSEKDITEEIIRILLKRDFYYQSAGRSAHLLPALRRCIDANVSAMAPVPVFFLFHGGYRASAKLDNLDLVFEPDMTELLLLFQIARFQKQVQAVYPPGVSFTIVINNGVAAYTNDIPYSDTEAYVDRLRRLIDALGAGCVVKVLMQSASGDFAEHMRAVVVLPATSIDQKDHHIVERFLGRRCSDAEARMRISRYVAAENEWAVLLGEEIRAASGFYLRQVAHPACLSFRPFPGGATRVQNGTIGFRIKPDGKKPVPFLLSAKTGGSLALITIPIKTTAIVPGGLGTLVQ